MYPDELATTEAVLRAFPDALAEMASREDYILSRVAGSAGSGVRVQGGRDDNQGDRYAIAVESDARLVRAREIVNAVRRGLKSLSVSEDRCVRAVYFEATRPAAAAPAVGLSVSYLRQSLESAKCKLAEHCIGVYPQVCQLRAELRADRQERLARMDD